MDTKKLESVIDSKDFKNAVTDNIRDVGGFDSTTRLRDAFIDHIYEINNWHAPENLDELVREANRTDSVQTFADNAVQTSTADKLDWAKVPANHKYIQQSFANYTHNDIFDILNMAQYLQAQHVAEGVLDALEAQA